MGSGWPSSAAGHVSIQSTGAFDTFFINLPRSYSATHFTGSQPRVGIAYTVDSKSVFRAGAGRYIARQGVSDGVFLRGNPPLQSVASIANGLPSNPGGSGAAGSYPVAIGTIDKNSPYPESWTWNATYERQIGFETVVGLSYVGQRGLHSQLERNINQLQAGALQADRGVNVNALRPLCSGIIECYATSSSSRYSWCRPPSTVDLATR